MPATTGERVQRFEATGLFERRLAVACDTACHTVAQAQGEPDADDEAVSAETLH